MRRAVTERLMARTYMCPMSGCWLFCGAINSKGYGVLTRRLAHRVAYELLVGPMPAGMCVCHRCDVRCCVNPAHLFLGTHQDNMDDMTAKGRRNGVSAGTNNRHAKLTWESVNAIREGYANGDSYAALARRYGVGPTAISRVCRGQSWVALGGSMAPAGARGIRRGSKGGGAGAVYQPSIAGASK